MSVPAGLKFPEWDMKDIVKVGEIALACGCVKVYTAPREANYKILDDFNAMCSQILPDSFVKEVIIKCQNH
jgi:hypothetical protein